VLPFVNMSGNPENEYFSDGLTDTLLHALAQSPGLKVPARTSAFFFKGQDIDIREIAVQLSVSKVLEGSVQRDGSRVRIVTQLIEAETGFHLWSSTYDRDMNDIFDVQDDIATSVALAVKATFADGEKQRDGKIPTISTKSVEAYDFYLQARAAGVSGSYEALAEAARLLTAALVTDPDFLDAKVALAENYRAQALTGMRQWDETLADMFALTDQVLAVDPSHRGARISRLAAEASENRYTNHYATWPEIQRQMQVLMAEMPGDNDIKLVLAGYLSGRNQESEALEILEAALQNDPLNARILYDLAGTYFELGKRDAARASVLKSLELDPGQPNAYIILGDIAGSTGDGTTMLKSYIKAMTIDPSDLDLATLVAENLYYIGLPEFGDRFRSRVMAVEPNSVRVLGLSFTRAMMVGDNDVAAEFARGMIETGEYWRSAVLFLVQNAVVSDDVWETIVFLDKHIPGFSDLGNLNIPFDVHAIRFAYLDVFRDIKGEDEVSRYLDSVIEAARGLGLIIEDRPPIYVNVLAFRGETEAAIELMLSRMLTRSIAMFPSWRQVSMRPLLADIVADPRVQQELQRWDEEEARYREEVRAFLDEQEY
jgi:TolB-like protein/thioredoxin-like negative regulator of GroEL